MTKRSAIEPPLELWAGVECTINHVGDTFFDQLEWSGHTQRLDDLDLVRRLESARCGTRS